MSVLLNFIQDFLGQFFVSGFWGVIKGIGLGIANIFNFPKYIEIFKNFLLLRIVMFINLCFEL